MAAMKSGDKNRLETLRMMKSKILAVNARGDLPEKDIVRILQNYAKTLKESIEIMAQHGKIDESEKIKSELAIVNEYLPRMLSEEETRSLVKETVSSLGIASIKEMGLIMKEIAGKRSDVDGALVRKIVSEILQ
jgi:hypothetical protein